MDTSVLIKTEYSKMSNFLNVALEKLLRKMSKSVFYITDLSSVYVPSVINWFIFLYGVDTTL